MRLFENTQDLLAFAFINRPSGVLRVGDLRFAIFFMTAGRMVAGPEILCSSSKESAQTRKYDFSSRSVAVTRWNA
jgi:hypothetical protein